MAHYNLPLNDVYHVIDSYNTGGLENACICENCNKPIVNVAVIKNIKNETFHVGLDCAETLKNLKNFYFVYLEFKELKAIQAKLNKAKKTNDVFYKIDVYGDLIAYTGTEDICSIIFNKDIEFSKKYLNSYLKLVSNPEKIDFKYEDQIINLGVDRIIASQNENFKKTISVLGFDFDVSVIKKLRPDGKYNYLFGIESSFINERITFYSFNDIERKINCQIRKYKFENFNNKKQTK